LYVVDPLRPEPRTRTIAITKAAVKAKRAYFAALWALWRLRTVHGDNLTGTLKDMERIGEERLRQSYCALARAIGGASRRRSRNGKTMLSQSGLAIAAGIIKFHTRRVFAKEFVKARRAWIGDRPIDWSKLPPEWRVVGEQLRALEAQFAIAQASSWLCEGEEKT
jgi:hypothetical protein